MPATVAQEGVTEEMHGSDLRNAVVCVWASSTLGSVYSKRIFCRTSELLLIESISLLKWELW
jgi:hypothetical protein